MATQELASEVRSRTFTASKASVYDATLPTLSGLTTRLMYPIKSSGIITTGYKEDTGDEPGRMRLTALVEEADQKKVRVLLTLTVENSTSDGDWYSVPFRKSKAQKLHTELLQGIAQRLPK